MSNTVKNILGFVSVIAGLTMLGIYNNSDVSSDTTGKVISNIGVVLFVVGGYYLLIRFKSWIFNSK